jgi:DNA ligase-associated metallophosphoesterase
MPVALEINGEELVADRAGALYWPAEKALLLADLHLEKGSSYARSGQLLPPYDTVATLNRLGALVAKYAPRRIFFLGDAFHDPHAGERIAPEAVAFLTALGEGRELIWIEGNHDPLPPAQLCGARCAEVRAGRLVLRHIPSIRGEAGEIAGHLHPVARVATRAAVVRRACFVSDRTRAILPAFGAYTGGINIREAAIARLFEAPRVHVLGEKRVLAIALERCV